MQVVLFKKDFVPFMDILYSNDPLKLVHRESRAHHIDPHVLQTKLVPTTTFNRFFLKKLTNYNILALQFWKNITRWEATYGADIEHSLFADSQCSWSLKKISSMLDVMRTKVPGVTSPYLYYGMWKAL